MKRHNRDDGRCLGLALIGIMATLPAPAFSYRIDYSNGFTTGDPNLILNGSASIQPGGPPPQGSELLLTPDTPGQRGCAFYARPFNSRESFVTSFSYRITPSATEPHADGIAFVMQPLGTTALGDNGGGLGYGARVEAVDDPGRPYIDGAFGVEIDTFGNQEFKDYPDTHIAITRVDPVTHVTVHLAETTLPTTLADGLMHSLYIHYHPHVVGEIGLIEIWDGQYIPDDQHLQAFVHYPYDSTMYLGFTGATGSLASDQRILGWSAQIPEPATTALFSLGFAALLRAGRKLR